MCFSVGQAEMNMANIHKRYRASNEKNDSFKQESLKNYALFLYLLDVFGTFNKKSEIIMRKNKKICAKTH